MGIINRKIDPNRRMLRQHPFDVYRALMALRLRDQVRDIPETFYTPEDIAKVLYSNYEDLRLEDQLRVLDHKLKSSLVCLKHSCFVVENTHPKEIRDQYGYWVCTVHKGLDVYKVRSNVFQFMARVDRFKATFDALDRDWGIILGRRNAFITRHPYSD